jgi:GNAT superfamily N-acetyltransferase
MAASARSAPAARFFQTPPGGDGPVNMASHFTIHPLTPSRWADLVTLFGEKGACGGCWCMWWRLKRSEFNQNKGDGNRQAFQGIVEAGEVPGLLAYAGDQPAGWCALAPREAYPALERSRILKRVDDQPVWSVTCFFVARSYRRRGLTVLLLQAAVEYARSRGAAILEGYPEDPGEGNQPPPFVFTGLASAFIKAGFVEAARRSAKRPIMRFYLEEQG